MPIRAILNGNDTLSINYDDDGWKELKARYTKCSLVMPCCEHNAIPKKSSLGNYFFAHSRKGECSSAPESKLHIYVKGMVAKIGQDEGWDVTTEKSGVTPSGEAWIADVYCTKGTAKLAIEIQCSPQTYDEFIRRQKRYAESGVRCIWLFKRSKRHNYPLKNIPQEHETPVFSFQEKLGEDIDDTLGLHVPQFGVMLDDFVHGIFTGRLQWYPKAGKEMDIEVIPAKGFCYRCNAQTGFVLGMYLHNKSGARDKFLPLTGAKRFEFFLRHVDNHVLKKHGIGDIKWRTDEERGSVLSNGCINCDALLSASYVYRNEQERPPAIHTFSAVYNKELFGIESDWWFDGYREYRHLGKVIDTCRTVCVSKKALTTREEVAAWKSPGF